MSQISLIIPLYNAVKHIRACLDSVVSQTFDDYEVILVDDGSTDETVNIIEEYTSKNKKFKLISQINNGVSSARNYGIETSTSPYVALLDQDDVLHPQALEVLYYLIKKYDTDVSSFDVKVVQDEFNLDKAKLYDIEKLSPVVIDQPVENFFENHKGKSIWVWNKLYKREAIKGVEFPVGVQPAEDTVFSLKITFNVKSIVRVNVPFLYYRLSTTSVMKKGVNENYVRSHAKAAWEMYNYFIQSGKVTGQRLEWVRAYLTRFIFKSLVSQPLRLSHNNEIVKLSQMLTSELYEKGALQPKLLGIQKDIACRAFIKKKFFWAKLFI